MMKKIFVSTIVTFVISVTVFVVYKVVIAP